MSEKLKTELTGIITKVVKDKAQLSRQVQQRKADLQSEIDGEKTEIRRKKAEMEREQNSINQIHLKAQNDAEKAMMFFLSQRNSALKYVDDLKATIHEELSRNPTAEGVLINYFKRQGHAVESIADCFMVAEIVRLDSLRRNISHKLGLNELSNSYFTQSITPFIRPREPDLSSSLYELRKGVKREPPIGDLLLAHTFRQMVNIHQETQNKISEIYAPRFAYVEKVPYVDPKLVETVRQIKEITQGI